MIRCVLLLVALVAAAMPPPQSAIAEDFIMQTTAQHQFVAAMAAEGIQEFATTGGCQGGTCPAAASPVAKTPIRGTVAGIVTRLQERPLARKATRLAAGWSSQVSSRGP